MFACHLADSKNECMGKISIILPKHRIVCDRELNAAYDQTPSRQTKYISYKPNIS